MDVIASFGINAGAKVGCAYHKYFPDPKALDIPAYLADALRMKTGTDIVNCADNFLWIYETGLRHRNFSGTACSI